MALTSKPGDGRSLVLLRHGRTSWNHEGRIQGHQDVGLDDTGRRQAQLVAPVLAALQPTVLWASDLGRARETAALVASACGLAVRHDPRLREFGFGASEGLSHAELAERDPEGFAALRCGDYDRVANAEPTAVVEKRMVEVLSELLGALAPGQTAVAVSHGAAIRVATAAMLDWPEQQFRTLRGLGNCGWVVLSERPDTGALLLEAYNRSAG